MTTRLQVRKLNGVLRLVRWRCEECGGAFERGLFSVVLDTDCPGCGSGRCTLDESPLGGTEAGGSDRAAVVR